MGTSKQTRPRKRVRMEVVTDCGREVCYKVSKGSVLVGTCWVVCQDSRWSVYDIEIEEEFRRKGYYAHGVLPRLADMYGEIWSSTTRYREWIATKAWESAGAERVGDRFRLRSSR